MRENRAETTVPATKGHGEAQNESPEPKTDQMVRSTKRLTNKERLRRFLEIFEREDRVLIVIMADPDAIASAHAARRLLSRRVEEVVIAHPNEIKRVNNLAMRDLLRIPLKRLKANMKDKFTKFILMDSQPPHNPDIAAFAYDAVVDHHPTTTGWDASFVDVRPGYGATASIMTEYLRAANMKLSVSLATALFYGIKVDTGNFTKKATPADVQSFQYLFKRMNQQLLNKIETADIRRSELKYFRTAMENMKSSKKRIYAHLDRVANPDILVLVADFFAHIHDVDWVIVSGFYQDKLVVIFRCDGYKKDAGKLAGRAFGSIGSAGGHRENARAEIPLKNLPEDSLKDFSTSTLQRLIVNHIGK